MIDSLQCFLADSGQRKKSNIIAYISGSAMWHALSSLFLLIFVSTAMSAAPADQTPEMKNSLIASLLEQGHDLDQQFSLPVHLDFLARQANMISRVPEGTNNELARQWANELFTLAAQAKQPMRSNMQGQALTILAKLDPDHALELLETAQLETTGPPSPKLQLARQAFQSLINSGGVSALPLLEQEAEQLGAQGQYPYAALAIAANDAVGKEWRGNPQHAREVLRSVFEPAFARYSQGAPDYANDFEFGEMLQFMAGGLPPETIQPALRLLVKNLLAADTSKYHYQAHVFSQNGEQFQTNNAADAAILRFGPLINRDAELVQQLEIARPELQAALECFKANLCRSWSFGRGGQMQRVPDPGAATRASAIFLAHTNPDLSVSKVESLPDDDKRTATELEVIRGLAGSRPDQAAQLLGNAQNAVRSQDKRQQLNVISAQVSLAAAQNQQEQLRQLLERGFELAGALIAQQPTAGIPPMLPGLPAMVQIAAQNYPDMTLTFLRSLPPMRMKADLLMIAALALQMPAKLPLGSPPNRPNLPVLQ